MVPCGADSGIRIRDCDRCDDCLGHPVRGLSFGHRRRKWRHERPSHTGCLARDNASFGDRHRLDGCAGLALRATRESRVRFEDSNPRGGEETGTGSTPEAIAAELTDRDLRCFPSGRSVIPIPTARFRRQCVVRRPRPARSRSPWRRSYRSSPSHG
jgi:hypothetical protein